MPTHLSEEGRKKKREKRKILFASQSFFEKGKRNRTIALGLETIAKKKKEFGKKGRMISNPSKRQRGKERR